MKVLQFCTMKMIPLSGVKTCQADKTP